MNYDVHAFVKEVTAYWRTHGRHDLPWRHTDAYGVLVSEVMLQQTQVERVIPFFERWMKTFPTPRTLARAPLSDVLRHWSGLGYNRRAKMLHECAKALVERHGGKIPEDRAALKALPGIGPYTAGAVRAFAFDEKEVFVETNIRAVLIHHFFPRSKKVDDKKLAPILEECLAKAKSPREWYSALMDYGTHLKKTQPNPSRRSKHHTKQSKFEGSLRQVRGAILRALVNKTSLDDVREAYAAQFPKAFDSLLRDGLIAR